MSRSWMELAHQIPIKSFELPPFCLLLIKHDYCKNPSTMHPKENDRASQHYAADLDLSPFSSCALFFYFFKKRERNKEIKNENKLLYDSNSRCYLYSMKAMYP